MNKKCEREEKKKKNNRKENRMACVHVRATSECVRASAMVYVLLLRVWKNILMFRSSNLFGRSFIITIIMIYTHETIESNRSFKTIVTSVLCVVLSGTRRRTKKKQKKGGEEEEEVHMY